MNIAWGKTAFEAAYSSGGDGALCSVGSQQENENESIKTAVCRRSVTKTETKILGLCGKELSLAGFDDLAKEAYKKMDDFANVLALHVKNQVGYLDASNIGSKKAGHWPESSIGTNLGSSPIPLFFQSYHHPDHYFQYMSHSSVLSHPWSYFEVYMDSGPTFFFEFLSMSYGVRGLVFMSRPPHCLHWHAVCLISPDSCE